MTNNAQLSSDSVGAPWTTWTAMVGLVALLVLTGSAPAMAQAPPSSLTFYPTYCSDRTGATDCSAGFAQWIADGIAQKLPLYAQAGTYRLASAQTVNLHDVATTGMSIFCDGPQLTKFVFDANVSSPNLQFVGNNFQAPNVPDNIFYLWVQGCGFRGNTNGTLVQIGRTTYGDAINETQLVNVAVQNSSGGGSAIALQLNFVLNSFINVVANAGAPTGTSPPWSNIGFAALDCRGCLFNNFFGSYSIGYAGVALRDGNNYGNVFHAIDDEVTTVAVWILNAGSAHNTFIGGQFALSSQGINATAGSSNKFLNPNFLGNTANKTGTVGVTFL